VQIDAMNPATANLFIAAQNPTNGQLMVIQVPFGKGPKKLKVVHDVLCEGVFAPAVITIWVTG
jgi:hypothetical protein